MVEVQNSVVGQFSIQFTNTTPMNTDKGDKSTDPTSLLQHVAARSKLISDRIQPKGLPHLERGFNTLDSELKKYSSKVSDISDPDADVKAYVT